MNPQRRRVAITGMGIISSLGLDRPSVQAALKAGTSGVRLLSDREEKGFRSPLSGTIEGFDPKAHLDRKKRKSLPEFGFWAWAAVEQALQQAGMAIDGLANDPQTGILFGNDSSVAAGAAQVAQAQSTGRTNTIGSGLLFQSMTSTISLNLATILKLRGISYTVSAACASGTMAIGQGAEFIARGQQERMICGGAQEITWEAVCSFDGLGAFSTRVEQPQKASRPFDAERDGLVPSGGAAAVMLESWESAEARGATILGEVAGFAMTSDGYQISAPSGEGLERAMRQTLNDAGSAPNDVDLILAHATATPVGDAAEAEAMTRVFNLDEGGRCPPISAVKGLTGHEFWMSGAAQAVYGLLMAQGGFAAGNPTLETLDSCAEKLNLPRASLPLKTGLFLANAAGFGGSNACLAIRPAP